MQKNFFWTLVGIGIIGGIVLWTSNSIFNQTAYVASSMIKVSTAIMISILCGGLIGIGVGGLLFGKKDDDEDEEIF